jgi:hypothetical protein
MTPPLTLRLNRLAIRTIASPVTWRSSASPTVLDAPGPPAQPPLSASLTPLPAVNLATLNAAIVIGAPVCGLRP